MFQIIKAYLKFLYHSKNEHGVQSPFVFDLVTKCFYDKKKYSDYQLIKQYRNKLLANKNYIEVTDFAADSEVFKSNKTQICKIAKTAGISKKRAELLYRIVKYFQPENILEIGTSLGLAPLTMSLANPKSKIISLEACPEMAQITKSKLQKANCNNIEIINTEFSKFFKSNNLQFTICNLQFIDGNHSKAAILNYFELLLPTITNNAVWIFNNIHGSSGMQDAWKIIKNNPKVTVTIDTFQWGFVFFRHEQAKEHFVIRV